MRRADTLKRRGAMRTVMSCMLVSVLVAGCSDAGKSSMVWDDSQSMKGGKDKATPARGAMVVQAPAGVVGKNGGNGDQGPNRADPEKSDATPRKVVYTANLHLVVESMDKTQTALEKAVEESKGYIAKS